MPTQPPNEQPKRGVGERVAKLVTNAGKIAGLWVGVQEALGQARPAVLLFATAIWMGSQATEDFVLKLIDRALE